jgi:hypothetical protein
MIMLVRSLFSRHSILVATCLGALLFSSAFATCLGDCAGDDEEDDDAEGDPCEGGVGCEKIP